MKTCPTCSEKLARLEYEGTIIWRCTKCGGVFVARSHLDIIRHRRIHDTETLKAEARNEFRSDTKRKKQCPGCFSVMEKRPIASCYTTMKMDCCKSCKGIWLDGGELAVAQLVFEASTRGRESLAFQKRMKELLESPERKAQFDAAMAKLPEDLPGDQREQNADILLELIRLLPFRLH